MSQTKVAQIAAHLNANGAANPDYKQIAEAKAIEINVGLYWAGTASNYKGLPQADVWQIVAGKWTRPLGSVVLGHDNIWRA